MSATTRYWLLAGAAYVSTRIVTGSAVLAFIASCITCLMVRRDDSERR